MARYTMYMEVPDELVADTGRPAIEAMLWDRTTEAPVRVRGEVRFEWAKLPPVLVDPYDWLSWWRKALVRLRLFPRPVPYEVFSWGVRLVCDAVPA